MTGAIAVDTAPEAAAPGESVVTLYQLISNAYNSLTLPYFILLFQFYSLNYTLFRPPIYNLSQLVIVHVYCIMKFKNFIFI